MKRVVLWQLIARINVDSNVVPRKEEQRLRRYADRVGEGVVGVREQGGRLGKEEGGREKGSESGRTGWGEAESEARHDVYAYENPKPKP